MVSMIRLDKRKNPLRVSKVNRTHMHTHKGNKGKVRVMKKTKG